MANLFAKAKKVETKKPAARTQKAEFHIPGLRHLAELDALVKSASSIMKTLSQEVKASALSLFIDNADGKKPESFRGIDENASASVECRKRGTNSPLSDDEVKLLNDNGIQVPKQVVVQQLFGINPKYAADEALLEKISAALEAAGVPEDVIVVQEEVSKFVVDDKAIEAAFKLGNPEVIETVVTLAIKPKLEETNIAQIMDDLKDVVVAYQPAADEKVA